MTPTERIVAAVSGAPDVDPNEVCVHVGVAPTMVAWALSRMGFKDTARQYYGMDVLREVEAMAGESPHEICRRLGLKPGSVARALARRGRKDLSAPFYRLDCAMRRERGQAC